MRINKNKLSVDLFFDLIHFIPFNIKWVKIRQKWIIYLNKTKEDVINLLKEINQVLSPFHEKDELKMLKSNAYALINTLDVAHAQLIYLIKYFCSASFEKKILEINWREEKAYHYATTEAIQTGLKIKIDIFVNLIKYLMEKLMDFIKGITDIHGLALGILVALKFGFKSEEKGK